MWWNEIHEIRSNFNNAEILNFSFLYMMDQILLSHP